MFAFKRFNFFHQQEVHGHTFPTNATCYAPNTSGHLFVGCDDGKVHAVDENAQSAYSFPAHGHKVFDALLLEGGSLLLTIGSQDPGYSSTQLKVWEVQKLDSMAASQAPSSSSNASSTPSTLPAPSGAGPRGGTGAAQASSSSVGQGSSSTDPNRANPGSKAPPQGASGGAANAGAASVQLPAPNSALLKSCRVFGPGYAEAEVTALAAAVSHQGARVTVAVGLSSGMVYVLAGELTAKGKLGAVSKLSARPDSGDRWCVMSLDFHSPATQRPLSSQQPQQPGYGTGSGQSGGGAGAEGQGSGVWGASGTGVWGTGGGGAAAAGPALESLFVVTESQTLSFNIQTGLKTILDQQGCAGPHLSLIRNGLLVVARDEGLYDFTLDTRAGCTMFEGTKFRLAALRRFLVVVTLEESELSLASGTATSTVYCLDLRNRMAASSLSLQGVKAVLPAWGALLAVTGAGRVYLLKQVDLAAQLDVFFKRSLHKLALDVARAEGADATTIASIHQRWADHLYAKGEYDAAMTQYLETLAVLEPSYVIRRFLDAQRIHNLTCYLEMLHQKGRASADHTTLLLNCYTKLKDVDKLDAFILGQAGAGHTLDPGAAGAGGAPGTEGRGGAGQAQSQQQQQQQASLLSLSRLPWCTIHAQPTAGASPAAAPAAAAAAAAQPALAFAPGGTRPLRFDAETAFKVLRAAGYHSHALWVASAAGQWEWVLDVLIEDCADYDEAVAYLDTLPRQQRAQALRRHGKVLISQRPEEATRRLMELCIPLPDVNAPPAALSTAQDTSQMQPDASSSQGRAQQGQGQGQPYVAAVSDFAHLYSECPTSLMLLCEFIMNTNAHSAAGNEANEKMLYHTLLELYLADKLADEEGGGAEQGRERQEGAKVGVDAAAGPGAGAGAGGKAGKKAGSKGAAASEGKGVAGRSGDSGGGSDGGRGASGGGGGASRGAGGPVVGGGGSAKEQQQPGSGGKASSQGQGGSLKAERRAKALDLLQAGWPLHLQDNPKYEPAHALLLCRLHGFQPGLLFLYDRMRLYREVLQVHMDAGDYAGLIAATQRYGDASRGGDPQLWSEVLEYFVRQPSEECRAAALQVVDLIEAGAVLPPLVVLQALAKDPGVTLGAVRGYVGRQLARETHDLAKGRKLATQLASDTAAMRTEVQKLRTQPRVFQSTKCAASGQPLELPAVHFYCGHSYNQRSLGDNDAECPICAPEFRRVLDIKRSMAAAAAQQDRFFTELREAGDGFSVVAEHLGRGLMNMTAAAEAAAGGGEGGFVML